MESKTKKEGSIANWASSRVEYDCTRVAGILHEWEGSLQVGSSKKPKFKMWVPPREDVFKFNVDGVDRGKPRLAGIGGVLDNSFGDVLAMVSKHVGTMEYNEVEVVAILQVIGSFHPLFLVYLAVESESLNLLGILSVQDSMETSLLLQQNFCFNFFDGC